MKGCQEMNIEETINYWKEISEYDLEKFYPVKIEGTILSIAEIEAKLSNK